MATMRVHELAKEFGMTSKELLAKLQAMGIPAKNHASALVDAYVDKIRKDLGPELAERAAALEAKAAEEARKLEEAAAAEKARLEAEQAARKKAVDEERQRREAEKKAREEEAARKKAAEEAARPRDTAPHAVKAPAFGGLLAQIEEENKRLAAEKKAREEEAAKRREEKREEKRARKAQQQQRTPDAPKADEKPRHEKRGAAAEATESDRPRKGKEKGDRYSAMAKAAEKLQRDRVLEEAREQIAAAEAQSGGRRRKRKEKRAAEAERQREQEIAAAAERATTAEGVVQITTGSTVSEVANLLQVASNEIIKKLFLLGTPLTVNETMSDDLIELVAADFGREVKILSTEEEMVVEYHDDPADLKPRPPVVTVMGHVDHGKTSLLDAIRETGVVATEAGGITQAIGASVVHINGRQITFIDTPGHETFTAMRARGAQITDVIVLVVAADDGVMPQTIESMNHAKAANVPIVVAVNKIDKPGANPDRVRQELVEHGVIPEEWGGENMFVNVSAKKRIGIDDLLETIILQADVLELKANPDTIASGFVIEAKLDKGRGPVATVLVNRGTLHKGDYIVVGTSYGRVRSLIDPKGNVVETAKPSDPVEVLGLNSVPHAGDEFAVMEDEREARNLAEERALKARRIAEQQRPHMSLEDLFSRIDQGTTELNLVVKADTQGSIEALQDALDKMDQSEVKINVIHSAVGGITETDVTLAAASDAIIIGFGVRPQTKAKQLAEKEKVDIRTYRVIYKAIEEINAARVGLLKPEMIEV